MKSKRVSMLLTIVAVLVWLAACQPAIRIAAPADAVGLPNPASVYCQEQGGRLKFRTSDAGQYGVCHFDDGSECDEWAYYRGECAAASAAGQ